MDGATRQVISALFNTRFTTAFGFSFASATISARAHPNTSHKLPLFVVAELAKNAPAPTPSMALARA